MFSSSDRLRLKRTCFVDVDRRVHAVVTDGEGTSTGNGRRTVPGPSGGLSAAPTGHVSRLHSTRGGGTPAFLRRLREGSQRDRLRLRHRETSHPLLHRQYSPFRCLSLFSALVHLFLRFLVITHPRNFFRSQLLKRSRFQIRL